LRCPQGLTGECFFQKHGNRAFGGDVHTVVIREKSGKEQGYFYLDSGEGLLECVQMGAIEFHVWACHEGAVEQPDRMIFDLDPDEDLDFAEVRRAACDMRGQLADRGLESFPMLTGGKGIHVVVPLRPGHRWKAHAEFARNMAETFSSAEPDRFTATMSKARRKGRIFIDWLRNQRGSTAVAPYSVRARPGAPVAVPVTWSELPNLRSAAAFSMGDAGTLLDHATHRDLQDWGCADQSLPDR
jgi:bifunctional non-homologous end joining protein LigD